MLRTTCFAGQSSILCSDGSLSRYSTYCPGTLLTFLLHSPTWERQSQQEQCQMISKTRDGFHFLNNGNQEKMDHDNTCPSSPALLPARDTSTHGNPADTTSVSCNIQKSFNLLNLPSSLILALSPGKLSRASPCAPCMKFETSSCKPYHLDSDLISLCLTICIVSSSLLIYTPRFTLILYMHIWDILAVE